VANAVWSTSVEAEQTALTAATVYYQDPQGGGGWKFLASGSNDVGSFNRPTSKAEWTVTVPRTGRYRFQVIGGTPGRPAGTRCSSTAPTRPSCSTPPTWRSPRTRSGSTGAAPR
jgi:hypothetical protein